MYFRGKSTHKYDYKCVIMILSIFFVTKAPVECVGLCNNCLPIVIRLYKTHQPGSVLTASEAIKTKQKKNTIKVKDKRWNHQLSVTKMTQKRPSPNLNNTKLNMSCIDSHTACFSLQSNTIKQFHEAIPSVRGV